MISTERGFSRSRCLGALIFALALALGAVAGQALAAGARHGPRLSLMPVQAPSAPHGSAGAPAPTGTVDSDAPSPKTFVPTKLFHRPRRGAPSSGGAVQ